MAKIRNNRTGEIIEVPNQDLSKYGIQTPISQGSQSQPNNLMNTLQTIKGVADFATFGGGSAVEESVRRQKERGKRPQEMSELLNPLTQGKNFYQDIVQPGVGPAIKTVGMYKALPFLWKNFLTRGGISNLTSEVTGRLTEKGVEVPFETVKNKMKEEVIKKYGKGPEVIKVINNVIKEKTSEVTGGKINPAQLLEWRKQIAARLGSKNFLQRIFGGTSLPEKVEGTARSVVSKELQSLSSSVKVLDKVYKKQSQIYPWLRGAGGVWLLNKILGGGVGRFIGGLLQ